MSKFSEAVQNAFSDNFSVWSEIVLMFLILNGINAIRNELRQLSEHLERVASGNSTSL